MLVPDLLPELDPRTLLVVDGVEVLRGEDAVQRARPALDRTLGEALEQAADEGRVGAHVAVEPLRLVAELEGRELRQGGVRRGVEAEHQIGTGRLQRRDLRSHVGVAGRVALGLHDLLVEVLLETLLAVGPEVVVLEEQADLRVGHVLGDVLADHLALALVVGLPAEGPRQLLRVLAPLQRPGGDEQVGNALVVEEVHDRAVGRGAQPADHGEDLVLEDQLVGDRARLRGVVAVVADEVLDLAPVHSAGRVHVVEVGLGAGGDLAVARSRDTGQREVATDLDRVVGDPDGAAAALGTAPPQAARATAATPAVARTPSLLSLVCVAVFIGLLPSRWSRPRSEQCEWSYDERGGAAAPPAGAGSRRSRAVRRARRRPSPARRRAGPAGRRGCR